MEHEHTARPEWTAPTITEYFCAPEITMYLAQG